MPIEKFLSKIEPFWDKSVTREVGWGEEELRAAAGVTGAVRRAAATSQQFVSGYSVVSLPERFNSRCWRWLWFVLLQLPYCPGRKMYSDFCLHSLYEPSTLSTGNYDPSLDSLNKKLHT